MATVSKAKELKKRSWGVCQAVRKTYGFCEVSAQERW